MNPFLGVFFHWLGGLASGSFYVPYKGVKKWAWEVYWLVGGFFSWIICPWVLALLPVSYTHLFREGLVQGGMNRGLEGRIEVVIPRTHPPKRGRSPRTQIVTPSTK